MITEKNIYRSWKRRFAYPTNKYGKKSLQFVDQVSSLRPISFKRICSAVESAEIVLAGSDGLSIEQTKKMIRIMWGGQRFRRIFITSRFSSKHQSTINKYLQTKIKLEKLLEKITDNWLERENFRLLLPFLQRNKIHVVAVGSEDFLTEDRKIINEIQEKDHRFDKKIIWLGPARLTSFDIQSAIKKRTAVSLYFQFHDLRWKFSKSKNWQEIEKNTFVDLSVSPLVAMDDFNASMEYDDSFISVKDFEKTSKMLLRKISKLLGQKKYPPIKNIFHVFDVRSIDRINRTGKNKNTFQFLTSRILAGESATLPKQKTILLCTRRLSHLSEEIAHYLRTAHRADHQHGQASTIVEEALAFFASLLVNPRREIPKSPAKTDSWDEVHAIGYDIGFQLLRAWNQSKKMRKEIRTFWNTYPNDEIESELLIQRMLS